MKICPFLKSVCALPCPIHNSVYQASSSSPYLQLCVNFCVHVRRPNHYIQLTSQFSVFWIFRHFCNHSPQSLHNNNLEIFVFAIFGNFGEISRPNVRKLRGHSVLICIFCCLQIHRNSCKTTLDNKYIVQFYVIRGHS